MTAITLERLRAIVAALPPPPPKQTYCSSKLFPADGAICFRGDDGEEFTVAGPDFWRATLRIETVPEFRAVPFDLNGLHGIPVIDLDRNRAEHDRVTGIMRAVMELALKP